MPGEGVTLMAIDQKANLGYRGKVGVERSDDGEQGKGFGLNARGVRLGKGSTEIDDCHLIGDGGCVLGVRDGHQEDFINAGYSAACTAGAGDGVSGLGIVEGLEQSFKEDTGPGAIVVRQRKVEVFLDQRTVGMAAAMVAELFGSCTNHGECEAVCPKEIPLEFIGRMNHDLIRAVWHRHREPLVIPGVVQHPSHEDAHSNLAPTKL